MPSCAASGGDAGAGERAAQAGERQLQAHRPVGLVACGAVGAEPRHVYLFDAQSEFDAGHIRPARECDLIVVAPATADLLRRATIYSRHATTELVTPTGAAIATATPSRTASQPPSQSW